ncbi:3-oxoacyl-[acyl-carrier-protein] synthase III C-terminal domain-containing protein [Chryseobacterium sp. MYb264]|uniref:3-oxoacyl-ACP synthase III family protein n=1 Tax=Chryseobacterium sp. MYb264 TaxID=2745153 RepID=UPI002E15E45A|nr:3-oxoacyl-[acyl-carrier-protein] synthase III C-terminal domain-containing protein [Chryseobacterium sp. MYb264]
MKISHSYLYVPSVTENNEAVIQEFEQRGISMQKIQNALGRSTRFLIPEKSTENTFTMSVDAAKKVLEQSHINIADIDMIIFVSATPEYHMPTNAIKIHRALGAKHETLCYDMNSNCIGGFVALDQVSKYLAGSKNRHKALVICSERFSDKSGKENPIIRFCFSDSALAYIIEKDDTDSGLIDVLYHTDSTFTDTIVYPPNGHSCYRYEDEIFWDTGFDGSGSVNFALNMIDDFLKRNHLTIKDIQLFLFSQLSAKNIQTIINHYEIPADKAPFYGREIAYTGSSSPLAALDLYQRNVAKLQQGDYVLIWTLGAGYQAGLMLWKY